MNFLEPTHVAEEVVKILEENKASFTFGDLSVQAIEHIARKPESESEDGITPPWLAVAYFFEDDGEVLPSGDIHNLPITIAVICSSTPGQATDVEALREAMHYARLVKQYVIGEHFINIGTEAEPKDKYVHLSCTPKPFEILEASADLAMVGVFFEYKDEF